jgi:IclR family pca regulon transcriptional regulator
VDQQLEEGLSSVAAPIVDPAGRVAAALSVCAHAGRVDPVALRSRFLPLVVEMARRIGAAWLQRTPHGTSRTLDPDASLAGDGVTSR